MNKPNGCYTLAPKCRRGLQCLIFPLLGAAAVIFLVRWTRSVESFDAPATVAPRLSITAPPAPEPVAQIDAGDALLADYYPSKQSAVRALAQQLPDAIAKINDKPTAFRMGFDDRPVNGALLYKALRKHFSAVPMTGVAEAQKAAGDVAIGLRIEDELIKPPRKTPRGSVQVTIATADRATSISAKFIQCEWADDLADYINEHPGHTWIVARSPKPCMSTSEARRTAEEAAADALLRMIQTANPASTAPLGLTPSAPVPLQSDIRAQLPVSQRFVQQFRRPYANVYTESILLDVSQQWLDGLGRRQANLARVREARVETTAGSMVIVLITILGAYLFANAVTKNYFTGRLRATAIVCVLIALAVTIGIISIA